MMNKSTLWPNTSQIFKKKGEFAPFPFRLLKQLNKGIRKTLVKLGIHLPFH